MITDFRFNALFRTAGRGFAALLCGWLLVGGAQAQQPSTEPTTKPTATSPALAPAEPPPSTLLSEEELRQLLVGKPLYLRSGYLDNTLDFNEHGVLTKPSPQGSYTLCALDIQKVRLTKKKVELDGLRYGLHFVGQLAYEDPTSAVDRVQITPKKKLVRITIAREQVVTPKKKKPAKTHKNSAAVGPIQPATPSAQEVTVTPAHTNQVLKEALDHIFAPGLDPQMLASMPAFWQLYYQAAAAHTDYRPQDPAVLRQNTVDRKAHLLTNFEPPSNEYAQANTVAGPALYHVVVGTDGKAQEIAVARPIGFGLDENAVESIRKATFEPALKDGKPVPVLLDLVVQFRIYSKRTAATAAPDTASKTTEPQLPGPYSVSHP
jgi:outer membrane biosynthesis protein TonB